MPATKPSREFFISRIPRLRRPTSVKANSPLGGPSPLLPILGICFIIVFILQATNLAYQAGLFGGTSAVVKQTLGNTFKPTEALSRNPVPPMIPLQVSVPQNPANIEIGPADAPVTLTVFTDPACVPCRMALQSYVREIPAGDLRLVYKYWPANPANLSGGILLEMARRNGKQMAFWNLLQRQSQTPSDSTLMTFIESLGIPLLQQRAILAQESDSILTTLGADTEQAHALNLAPPPQLILNDYLIDGTILTPAHLATYVHRLKLGQSLIQSGDIWLNPTPPL